MPDLTVVTVEYGNPADTELLAASLASLDGAGGIKLVIVDNRAHESDPPAELSSQSLPFAVCRLRPRRNLYYWGGAAHAIDTLRREKTEESTWLMVCNNDITIANTDFLGILRAIDPSLHPIVAPSIISSFTGRDQNPMLDSPAGFLKRAKWRMFDTAYPVARGLLAAHDVVMRVFSLVNGRRIPKRDETARNIYAAHGACVIVSKEFFAAGSLDTTVPMFAEELTLAEEAVRMRLPISYLPTLRITHREHSTTGPTLTRAKHELQRRAHQHYFSIRKLNAARA